MANNLKLKLKIQAEDSSKPALNSAKKSIKDLSKATSKNANVAETTSNRIKSSNNKIAASYQIVARGANVAKLAIFGIFAAIGGSITGLARSNAEFEKLSASLETVTGSADNAKVAFKIIEDFSKTTPFELTEVVDAFIKLKALGLDPSKDALLSYGNTASAMGKSLNQFIEAVADASTSEFERLKEFGIKAKQQGKDVSFTFQGVTTTVGNNAKEIEGFLRGIGNVQFAGAMARQMQTLGGSFSNFGDQISAISRAVGQSGFNDAIKRAFSGINEFLAEIVKGVKDNSAEIKIFFDIISNTALIAGNAVKIGFNIIQVAIKSGVALVLPPLELLSRALSLLTVGDTSKAFELMANDVRGYSRELKNGIKEDFKDISVAAENIADIYIPVEEGIKKTAEASNVLTTAIDATTAATKKAAEEAKKLVIVNEKQLNSDAKRVYAETRTELEKLNQKQARYNKLLKAGKITQDTFNRATLQNKKDRKNIVTAPSPQTSSLSSASHSIDRKAIPLSEQAAQRAVKWEEDKLALKEKQFELDRKNPFLQAKLRISDQLDDPRYNKQNDTFNFGDINIPAKIKLPTNEELKAKTDEISPEIEVLMRPDEQSAIKAINETISRAQQQVKTITIPVISDSKGGNAKGFATGGLISGPGTTTSDSILARVSRGEYVLNAAAVNEYGVDFISKINQMKLPKFATGGLVSERLANISSVSIPSAKDSQAANGDSINITLPSGEKFGPFLDQSNSSAALQSALNREVIKRGRLR